MHALSRVLHTQDGRLLLASALQMSCSCSSLSVRRIQLLLPTVRRGVLPVQSHLGCFFSSYKAPRSVCRIARSLVIAAILKDPTDKTTISLLYANQTESDILVSVPPEDLL
eukprot:2357561-Pleurochrysis_carterae.AAC.1